MGKVPDPITGKMVKPSEAAASQKRLDDRPKDKNGNPILGPGDPKGSMSGHRGAYVAPAVRAEDRRLQEIGRKLTSGSKAEQIAAHEQLAKEGANAKRVVNDMLRRNGVNPDSLAKQLAKKAGKAAGNAILRKLGL